jgi:hypothetical protein
MAGISINLDDPYLVLFTPSTRRRCDVNRSLVLGFERVPSFLAERAQQTGKGQSRSSEREPKGNLDGFLARLHNSQQNEGQAPRERLETELGRICVCRSVRKGGTRLFVDSYR